jgi:hypothetical protein
MADPTLLVPGMADHRTMEPLWNKGTDVIRTVDNTTLIFFEGSTYGTLAISSARTCLVINCYAQQKSLTQLLTQFN